MESVETHRPGAGSAGPTGFGRLDSGIARVVTLTASASHVSLRRMRIAWVSLAFAALTLVASTGTTAAWNVSTFGAPDEQLLFSLTNRDRASAGLPALVNDPYLHKEAEWRAKDMGDRSYFSHHIPPGNEMVFDYMQRDGYCFDIAGENIGVTSDQDSVATGGIEVAFMNSKPHRENILGKWDNLGVGAYKATNGDKFYAVLFSIPCSTPTPRPTHKPTPRPTPRPTPTPTLAPTLAPTPTPTPVPTATPGATGQASVAPTVTPSPSASPSEAPSATAAASPKPASESSTPGVGPSGVTVGPADLATPPSGDATSLRVHEQSVSGGPVDSLFHSLFGGLFGW